MERRSIQEDPAAPLGQCLERPKGERPVEAKYRPALEGPVPVMETTTAKLPGWYRALATVVGLISIALAFVVLAFPGLAVLTLVFLLGFALLVIGIDRVAAGITGHPFGWMNVMQPPAGTPPSSGSSSGPVGGPQTPK